MGNDLILLVNHFKNKGFGSQKSSTPNGSARLSALKRFAKIYVRAAPTPSLSSAISSDSGPITPLTKQTDLNDISAHNQFDNGGRPGTFGSGTKSNKIDHILMSPELFAKAKSGGIFRKEFGAAHSLLHRGHAHEPAHSMVDDEPEVELLFRQQFRHDLRAGRFAMELAQSAPAALERITVAADARIILILSDINMPGMSGLELLPKAKAARLRRPNHHDHGLWRCRDHG